MKFSLFATFLILAIGGIYGLMNHSESTARLDQKHQLDAKARQLGITLSDPRSPRRQRDLASNKALGFASGFIAFATELERHQKAGDKPDPEYDRRLGEIGASLTALDAAELRSVIAILKADKKLSAETRGDLISVAIFLLADEHPSRALGLYVGSVDLLEDTAMGQHTAHLALRKWAKLDPTAAIAWVKNNARELPGGVTDELNDCVITAIAETDPTLGFKLIGVTHLDDAAATIQSFIETSKTPAQRTAVLAALRDHLAKLPASEERDELLQESLETMGRNLENETFATASAWLDAAKLSPTEATQFAAGLSYFNTKEDTGRWIDWMAQTLPKGTFADHIETLVGQWTQQDYLAAGKWLTAAPAGEAKAAAVRIYAKTVAEYEPQTAVQWALTLPAGPQRQGTMESIFRNWPPADPSGAAEFAKQYGIDPTLQP